MEEFTYQQIREKALKQGVPDTKRHISLWATINSYMRCRRMKQGKRYTIYMLLQRLAY
jgi:hypothetical protein